MYALLQTEPRATVVCDRLESMLAERLARCDTCGKPLGGDEHIHTCSPQRLAQPEFDSSLQSAAMTQTPPKLAQPEQYQRPTMRRATREEKIDRPGVYWVPVDTKVNSEAIPKQIFEPEQEPVAKVVLTEQLGLPTLQWLYLDRSFDFKGGEFLYTTPPRREWQGLTDEEVDGVKHTFDWASPWTLADFARAIEAKLREKNA